MTSLIAWVATDNRGQTSFYLASDSRISWSVVNRRDAGRKTYACSAWPHIFAYCGDVLFPTTTITQVMEFVDAGLLEGVSDIANAHIRVLSLIQAIQQLSHLPVDHDFSILHASRESRSLTTKFHLWEMSYLAKSGVWLDVYHAVPNDHSSLIVARGTGSSVIKQHVARWQNTSLDGTSRAIFSAFCDAILSETDRRSGGAPQVVALYRDGNGRKIGTVIDGERFFFGSPVPPDIQLDIEWRDRLFQRIDGTSLNLVPGATRQPRPRGA